MDEINFEQFASELDSATLSHLDWSRRIVRYVVLHCPPGDDVLDGDAHLICRFGLWFIDHRAIFDEMDAVRALALEEQHLSMHNAIRAIFNCIINGKPGDSVDLDNFEMSQTRLIENLAYFKTLAITRDFQRDALTGLPLRHNLEQNYELLNKHTRRHETVLVVMMLDVDHFKAVNDQHGHAAGDIVLKELATILRQTIREEDMAYRYGGEEFLLLVEIASAKTIPAAADRILEAIRNLAIKLPSGAIVTPKITAGVTQATNEETLDSVVQRADKALYQGKNSGRNKYVIAH